MSVTEILLITFLVWQISAMPIPSWIASAFFGVDQYDYNEKSEWAENRFSFGNGSWAYLIFSLEFVKGLLAVSLLGFIHAESVLLFNILPLEYLLAFVIVLGHTFPIYNEFNKSRSAGAFFGLFAGLWLIPALIGVSVFLVMWVMSKKDVINSLIVSLGSILLLTFILFDVKALVIASMLSTTLMSTNFHQKLMAVKA
jgi:glycerol-3-phosphate acyltransferase PlsY